MWEYIQPFRPETQPTTNFDLFQFVLNPKGKAILSTKSYPPPEIPWKRYISALLSILRLFDPPHRTLLHRASHSPNHFSPSLAVRREPTVPGGCQNSLALAAMLSPSHRPADLGSPQRDAEPVVTVCVVSGSHANSHSHKIMTI